MVTDLHTRFVVKLDNGVRTKISGYLTSGEMVMILGDLTGLCDEHFRPRIDTYVPVMTPMGKGYVPVKSISTIK